MKKVFFSLLIILSITLSFSGCNNQGTKDKEVVKIACNIPLTGNLAVYGESVRNGIELAQNEFKSDDADILSFDFQDNMGQSKNSVTVLNKHLLSNFDIYVTGVTQQTMAIIDKLEQIEKPYFVWGFTPLYLNSYESGFRTYVNFGIESDYYLKYVEKVKPKNVAFVFVNIAGTNLQYSEVLKPNLDKLGINLIAYPYDISTLNFNNIVTKIEGDQPDLIILNGFKEHVINLVKSFREHSLIKNGNTICSFDLLDAAPEMSNESLEGLVINAPIFESRKDNKTIMDWKAKYREQFKKEPLYTDAYAYDFANIILAIAKAHNPKSSLSWKDNILQYQSQGITGPIKFNDGGELILAIDVCKYSNGKLVPIIEF
nr:ABC transporter substrate-binding protein [Bacteroidota bacterium]